jgi:hypothetical protein
MRVHRVRIVQGLLKKAAPAALGTWIENKFCGIPTLRARRLHHFVGASIHLAARRDDREHVGGLLYRYAGWAHPKRSTRLPRVSSANINSS